MIDAIAGDYFYLLRIIPHRFELQSDVKGADVARAFRFRKNVWDNSAPAPTMQLLPIATEPPPPQGISYFVQSLAYGLEIA